MARTGKAVKLSRPQALRLARYERNSLRARARTSAACSTQWAGAARQAQRVVGLLEIGDDAQAADAALLIPKMWKSAADCEGWPTPRLGNQKARNGEVNYHLFDRYTVAHYATGIGLGVMRLKWWQALLFSVGWEIIETPLKRAIPGAFPYSSEDTLVNALGDTIGMMAGWGSWQLLERATKR